MLENEGWTYFEKSHKFYKAFFEQTKQPEAKQRCQDKGGQLATIHSKEENDLIYRLIRDPNPTFLYSSDWMYFAHSWIGLERASDGGFRWPDGSPTDYTNWGSSEPSNFEGLENCAHINPLVQPFERGSYGLHLPGKWNDIRCDATLRGYVCEVAV
ncbi:hypothetical protein Q1695_004504 [Nippostrongylus brasiliensis]|nr:hypothetical protein Q1695_004504 [Nippostrongylus brasiliensis]